MAISRMKPENQVTLLRDAAKKVRTTRIPHIIDEDSWVARPADNVENIHYQGELRFPLGENIRNAIDSLSTRDSFLELLMDKEPTALDRWKERAILAFYSIKRTPKNLPDSSVNGNLVHWMEHSMHIALFSPAVAGAVYDMLLAEADRIEKGTNASEKTTASKELMDLARMLVEKEVWDYSSRRFVPMTKLELLERELSTVLNRVMPGRKTARSIFPREGIADLMQDKESFAIARQINLRYSHLSPEKASRLLHKQWQRAMTNYINTKKKGEDPAYWEKAMKLVAAYLTALGSNSYLRHNWENGKRTDA